MSASIKICGLKTAEEIRIVNDFRISYAGFIFAPSSRQVDIARARELVSLLRDDIKAVGVFRNQDIDYVNEAIKIAGLDFVQLHGSESPEYCRAVENAEVIKVIGVDSVESLKMADEYKDDYIILLDTRIGNQSGGTGKSFDWKLLQGTDFPRGFILAGGIGPDNIREAMKYGADIIDVNSGVETDLIKDRNKIARVFGNMEENMTKFGKFGGQYVPETLMAPLKELEENYKKYINDREFTAELNDLLKNYVGRETPLYYARRLSEDIGGAKIYLKREDLNHTGAHKINNVLGQVLLAKRMGKRKIIAETGAGQHGVATATGAALMGMECTVYMGEEDVVRQELNVFKMKLLGAKIEVVTSGTRTLKDATNEAIRAWVAGVEDSFYVIGSVVGPHPYPMMVRDFQRVIGDEARRQVLEAEGKLPHSIIACVGGGSNAMGIFYPFVEDRDVRLIGVEAGGLGISTGKHAAVLSEGANAKTGVLHGMKTKLLTDENGNIIPAHSISAGLDYPGIGPEHAFLADIGRV